jgi:ATP-dependent helicase IRC3
MQLRPKQHEALTTVRDSYTGGLRRVVVVAATGFGKTVVFSNLPKYLPFKGQMLVLAHRDELIDQAAKKMRLWNPHLRVEIEKGQDQWASPDADVIIASVATLGREGSKRIERFDKNRVKCIVVDECHHSIADTYLNVFNYFNALDEGSETLIVGVTATPGRSDGEGLAKVYQKIIFQYTLKQAVKDGWLASPRPFKVYTDTNLDKVGTIGGDFDKGELADEVNNPGRNQAIVKAFLETAGVRPTIAFTVDIKHAKDLAEMFNHYGIKAAAVWGDDPERKAKLELHKRGAIQVLCNYGVLTEGYDDWRVSCIIMARPTKSQTVFIQCVGRGLRIEDEVGNLIEARDLGKVINKGDCLVLDVVDNTKRHSLVTVPSLFGMNAKMDLEGRPVGQFVEELEKLQRDHPEVDFSTLQSIDEIQVKIEEAEVWNVKFPQEVIENSTMSWMSSFDGGFALALPTGEQMTIKQNMLDQWEIYMMLDGQGYRGQRDALEDAFTAAEELIIKLKPEHLRLLQRNAKWTEGPASEAQMKQLRRLYKGKSIPATLSKGQASRLIDRAQADEATVPATPEQLRFIRKFNKDVSPTMTKQEAKRAIAKFIKGRVTRA